jgi:hypothetical protein
MDLLDKEKKDEIRPKLETRILIQYRQITSDSLSKEVPNS